MRNAEDIMAPPLVPGRELAPGYEPLVTPHHQDQPRMARACHDCAFRSGSNEQQDLGTWMAVMRGVDVGDPFWCHQGMPCAPDGRYAPEMREVPAPPHSKVALRMEPVGARICAGWLAMRERVLDVRRRDLADDLKMTPAWHPETFTAALAAVRTSYGRASS
jgi:hypothetical protein